jgi:hypothetical protein
LAIDKKNLTKEHATENCCRHTPAPHDARSIMNGVGGGARKGGRSQIDANFSASHMPGGSAPSIPNVHTRPSVTQGCYPPALGKISSPIVFTRGLSEMRNRKQLLLLIAGVKKSLKLEGVPIERSNSGASRGVRVVTGSNTCCLQPLQRKSITVRSLSLGKSSTLGARKTVRVSYGCKTSALENKQIDVLVDSNSQALKV